MKTEETCDGSAVDLRDSLSETDLFILYTDAQFCGEFIHYTV